MNSKIKETFFRMKPICDIVMVCPSAENVNSFIGIVSELRKEDVQELQQYLLFPLITHIRSTEIKNRHEQQRIVIDAMKVVLERVTVNSFEMCMKIETGLLSLTFDKNKPGMIAAVPEELKLSIMRCLTVLMLNIDSAVRQKLLKTQVPLLAQTIFVSVHIAKLEKLRSLRLAAISNVTAHTATHEQLTDDMCHVRDGNIEVLVVDMLSSILPGVLAALQDVAMCKENPGHAVVVAALNATHRILCLTMHDKHLKKKSDVTAEDFANMIALKTKPIDKDVSSKGVKDVTRMSPEWYAMAGEKLTLVIKSLVPLSTHEHVKIRKELAVLSARILRECNASMQPSIPVVLDILISLAKDEYPEVFEYCTSVVNAYFTEASQERRLDTMDCLCENFLTTLTNLPRILNNIDSGRKLAALNLMHGYVRILSDGSRPQRLTTAMTSHTTLDALCEALRHAAALSTDLTLLATHADRELTAPPPTTTPWRILRHLDTKECEQRLQDICQLLAEAECAELLLDHLLELFQQRECEVAYIMNCFGSAPNSSPTLVKRILDTYLEEDVWYLPLEVCSSETPVTKEETLDVEVYNPRAWMKDSVPGLFEGATETRYTGISYAAGRHSVASGCSSVAAAQRNAALCCLLTEGVGALAFTLRDHFQPYLLKTLCLVLERVGSRYELLHLAGLKAINDIALACGHSCVAELIAANADYLTSQITNRLKKAWNIQSALEILSVVMEYSNTRILDYLYGIVDDVLVQSCDKFHERDLYAYLQVFLTFITRIRKWFHVEEDSKTTPHNTTENFSVLKDVIEFAKNKEEAERLLSKEEFEEDSGKSVEEMYREDLKKKEEDVLDYDDRVTHESPPLPRHVTVTVSILKRCINFITSKQRDDAILALKVLSLGLPILKHHENELLPLVHLTWAPLCTKVGAEPAVARAALDLLVTMATLSKDFIRNRAMKDVFPHMYKYLRSSSHDSLLKDRGSTYRLSPAYRLQEAMLAALPGLVVDLSLDEAGLEEAMSCVDTYLSKKQPKPLQGLAVIFFKHILASNYGAVWCHLRKLCANDDVIEPPAMKYIKLEPVVGTPYRSTNVDCEKNIKLIFEID